jgi:hypothetical protein
MIADAMRRAIAVNTLAGHKPGGTFIAGHWRRHVLVVRARHVSRPECKGVKLNFDQLQLAGASYPYPRWGPPPCAQ